MLEQNLFPGRIFALSALAITMVAGLAPAGSSCPPKKVLVRSTFPLEDEATSRVSIQARNGRASVELESENLPIPSSGEYRLLLNGDGESFELARFTPKENVDRYEFEIAEELRIYALSSSTFELKDGEASSLLSEPVQKAAMIELRTGKRRPRPGGHRKIRPQEEPTYDLGGLVMLRTNGETRHFLRARARHATPGSELTFRLEGGESHYDLSVLVNERGRGNGKIRGQDEIPWETTLEWTELVVLSGGDEVARIPLICP